MNASWIAPTIVRRFRHLDGGTQRIVGKVYTGLMKKLVLIPVLFLASCAKQEAPPAAELPHATVVMRDGTRVAGAVAATTPAEITINLDAGGSRTIPMKDVRRVDYGEVATAAKPVPPATAPVPVPAEPGSAP